MAAPTTHDWMDLEVVSATNLRNHINAPINYAIGRDIGSDAAIELEDSLALPAGAFFLGLPSGHHGAAASGGRRAVQVEHHDGPAGVGRRERLPGLVGRGGGYFWEPGQQWGCGEWAGAGGSRRAFACI